MGLLVHFDQAGNEPLSERSDTLVSPLHLYGRQAAVDQAGQFDLCSTRTRVWQLRRLRHWNWVASVQRLLRVLRPLWGRSAGQR
eukprot:1085499-Amphidinium_carterae.1